MEQITAYTDTNAIRGSLGVDDQDCPDSLIVQSNLELELEVDLYEWLPTHAAIFSVGSQTGADISDAVKKNYLLLYAQWYCAYELACRFLAFPQIVSDGKNQLNRFAKLDLEVVKQNAASRMAKYKGKLDALENNVVAAAGLSILAISTPGYDPVTNT